MLNLSIERNTLTAGVLPFLRIAQNSHHITMIIITFYHPRNRDTTTSNNENKNKFKETKPRYNTRCILVSRSPESFHLSNPIWINNNHLAQISHGSKLFDSTSKIGDFGFSSGEPECHCKPVSRIPLFVKHCFSLMVEFYCIYNFQELQAILYQAKYVSFLANNRSEILSRWNLPSPSSISYGITRLGHTFFLCRTAFRLKRVFSYTLPSLSVRAMSPSCPMLYAEREGL